MQQAIHQNQEKNHTEEVTGNPIIEEMGVVQLLSEYLGQILSAMASIMPRGHYQKTIS